MESIYTELALYSSKNGCARTDTVFLPISEVCNGTVSLTQLCSDKGRYVSYVLQCTDRIEKKANYIWDVLIAVIMLSKTLVSSLNYLDMTAPQWESLQVINLTKPKCFYIFRQLFLNNFKLSYPLNC